LSGVNKIKQKSRIFIVFSFAAQCKVKIVLSVLCAIIRACLNEITFFDIYQSVDCIEENTLFHFHENPNPDCPAGWKSVKTPENM